MLNHGDIYAKNLGLRPKMKRNGGRRNVYFDGEGKRGGRGGKEGKGGNQMTARQAQRKQPEASSDDYPRRG